MCQLCRDYDTFTCEGWCVQASGTAPRTLEFDVTFKGRPVFASLPLFAAQAMLAAAEESTSGIDPADHLIETTVVDLNRFWLVLDAAVQHYTVGGHQPVMAGLGEVV